MVTIDMEPDLRRVLEVARSLFRDQTPCYSCCNWKESKVKDYRNPSEVFNIGISHPRDQKYFASVTRLCRVTGENL